MGVKNYAKWVDDTLANTVIENKDLTPPVPTSSGYPTGASISTPTPGKASANDPSGAALGFASGASSGFSQGKNPTPNTYSKWADKGDTSTPGATPSAPQAIVTPGTIIKNNVQGMIDKAKDTYSKWLADESGKAEGGNAAPSTTPSAPVVSNPSTTAPTVTPMRSESGYAKWLATDPAMQARMRQAESDYYRNRAGYGVSGESLAQSGLIGSGWSSAMDAAAYSAMQAEKAGIRSEGYAKWLNEGGDTGGSGSISAAGSDIFQTMLDNGVTEMTDSYRAQLTSLGYSQSAIEEADKAMKDYAEKMKTETGANIQEWLGKLSEGESVENVLTALGVDTSNMDADTIGKTFGAYLDQAVEEGLVTAEERSKYLTDDALKDIEDLEVDADNKTLASTAVGIVDTATELKDSLTEADYKKLIDSAFDTLNVKKIELGKEGMPADEVRITVQDADGNTKTIVADWTSNPKNSLERELTKLFGSASLAVYDDKIYYQYKDGGWREIAVKVGWGSEGSTSYGKKVLKTVAQYVSDNKIDYRAKITISENDLEGVLDEDVLARLEKVIKLGNNATKEKLYRRVADMVNDIDKYVHYNESARRKYIDGRMTRDDFIKDILSRYHGFDGDEGVIPETVATLYVKFLDESLKNK